MVKLENLTNRELVNRYAYRKKETGNSTSQREREAWSNMMQDALGEMEDRGMIETRE